MSSIRLPGVQGLSGGLNINDGTLCRTDSPRPGTVGLSANDLKYCFCYPSVEKTPDNSDDLNNICCTVWLNKEELRTLLKDKKIGFEEMWFDEIKNRKWRHDFSELSVYRHSFSFLKPLYHLVAYRMTEGSERPLALAVHAEPDYLPIPLAHGIMGKTGAVRDMNAGGVSFRKVPDVASVFVTEGGKLAQAFLPPSVFGGILGVGAATNKLAHSMILQGLGAQISLLAPHADYGEGAKKFKKLVEELKPEHLLRKACVFKEDEPVNLAPTEWTGDSSQWPQEKKLLSMQPDLRVKVKTVLAALAQRGFQPKVIYGWRSVAVQLQLFKEGKSKVEFSFHNAQKPDGTPASYAADIVDSRYGWGDHAESSGFWKCLGEEAKKQNLYWGGDWSSFRDWAHIQLVPNSQLTQVKRESGFFKTNV